MTAVHNDRNRPSRIASVINVINAEVHKKATGFCIWIIYLDVLGGRGGGVGLTPSSRLLL
jgi:hypothetical protein